MASSPQRAGQPTTEFGPNVRYTVQLRVVGEDRRDTGSVRGADRLVEVRVVTPLGQSRAVALAALHFAASEPRSVFREVDVIEVDHDFVTEDTDCRDRYSLGR